MYVVGLCHNDGHLLIQIGVGFGFGLEKFDTRNHCEFAGNKEAILILVSWGGNEYSAHGKSNGAWVWQKYAPEEPLRSALMYPHE